MRIESTRLLRRFAAVAWGIVACGGDDSGARLFVEEDAALLCLLPQAGPSALYALSGACGCQSVMSSRCSAEVRGDRIVVSSTALVSDSGRELCNTACETKSARCEGTLPADGQYEIVQGSEQARVALPVASPQFLFGNYSPGYAVPDCDALAETLEAEREARP